MRPMYQLKIDIYSHIIPPKYKQILSELVPDEVAYKIDPCPALYNLEERFRIMDRYGDLMQVLTLGWPVIENIADSRKAVELAKIANDAMADLVSKYSDRFPAAIASLPMNNIDAALEELDRTIKELQFRGILIYTPINEKPMDSPEFMPLYEKMAEYNLPIFIHPMRPIDHADYRTETESKYGIMNTFGWPYETTAAMTRLVFSGVLEKHPNLKLITHHCGGMVPFFAERIICSQDGNEIRRGLKYKVGLTRAPIEYYKMFYADTALYGNTAALMCGFDFFGVDHLVFGTDWPLGDNAQYRTYRQTINAICQMNIDDTDRKKIYEDNARKLLRLPI